MIITVIVCRGENIFKLFMYIFLFCLFSILAFADDFMPKLQNEPQLELLKSSSTSSTTQENKDIELITSHFWTSISDIVVEGDTAFCAIGNGLAIYDVSIPANPTVISMLSFGEVGGVNLIKRDNYLYVASGRRGLTIVDVTDVFNPVVVGLCNTLDYALSLFIQDDYAYIADRYAGMQVINIADPYNPYIVGSYNYTDQVVNIFVSGTKAYLANSYGGLMILNVFNPAAPIFITRYNYYDVTDVIVIDTIAYVVDSYYGFKSINISDPLAPIPLDSVNYNNFFYDITIRDSLAYIANSYDGLLIVDISDPADLLTVFRDTTNRTQATQQIFLKDSLAYLANLETGFDIVNVQDPVNSHKIGGLNTQGLIVDVQVIDTIAYLLNKTNSVDPSNYFQTINIADPYNPILLDEVLFNGDVYSFLIKDTLVFIDVYQVGIEVINIKNPLNLQLITTMSFWEATYRLTIDDTLLYTSRSEEVDIYNIADINNPLKISSIYTDSSFVTEVLIIDTIAFLTHFWSAEFSLPRGLRIVNVADPLNPIHISTLALPTNPYSIVVQDSIAYVGCEGGTVNVVNISDLENPVIINSYNDLVSASKLQLSNNLLYLSDAYRGLVVLNIQDPYNITLNGAFNTPGSVFDYSFNDSMIYIADYYSFMILEGIQYECFTDSDLDGFGDLASPLNTITLGDCFMNGVSNSDDCDDNDPSIYPGAPEINDDGIDQNCDGVDATCCVNSRGNVDGDVLDQTDISDLVFLVAFMFQGGAEPPCVSEGNVDGSNGIDISDLVMIVDFMFAGGLPPAVCP